MIVADLSHQELVRRLAGAGLRLRTGPVVNRIQSRLPKIAHGVALHYADHAVEDSAGFADFHGRVAPPRSLRRWMNPQDHVQYDDARPFLPLPADQAFPMLARGLDC